jgi:hypothetical protein
MLPYSFSIWLNLGMVNSTLIYVIIGFSVLVPLQIYPKVQNYLIYQLVIRRFWILVNVFMDMPNFAMFIIPGFKFSFKIASCGILTSVLAPTSLKNHIALSSNEEHIWDAYDEEFDGLTS